MIAFIKCTHTISQGQIRSEDVYQETYTSEAGKARPVRAAAGRKNQTPGRVGGRHTGSSIIQSFIDVFVPS